MRIRPTPRPVPNRQPLQLQIALDGEVLRSLSTAERASVTANLANLLLLAAGLTVEESDDDDQR